MLPKHLECKTLKWMILDYSIFRDSETSTDIRKMLKVDDKEQQGIHWMLLFFPVLHPRYLKCWMIVHSDLEQW